MNFRRQPFQFTSIDPVKRHAELQKRFGLPSDEMYVDCVNPGARVMGAGAKESMMNGSPRLQHRVPVFPQDNNITKSAGIQNNVDIGKQPRVRVIPIQVEGVNDASKRHRTFSGPAGSFSQKEHPEQNIKPQPTLVNSSKIASQPRVCNIPIKIESKNKSDKVSKNTETVIPTVIEQEPKFPKESDGCGVSSTINNNASKSLKQIEDVLNKLKGYEAEVKEFTGTNKDKKYRYLDEMLTRCMLDLDNVDTLGLNDVRQSRKNAVKQVQACIDLLETKVSCPTTVAETNVLVVDTESSEAENAMVVDTEVKDNEVLGEEVMEKGSNLTDDDASSSRLPQACDIEMEDRSCEEQGAKLVVEELEGLCENLKEVGGTAVKVEEIPSEINRLETSVKDIIVEDITNGVSSGYVVEEMCSDGEKSPVKIEVSSDVIIVEEMCSDSEQSPVKIDDSSDVNIEQVVIEHPELSNSASNEQILNCSDKPDLCNINTSTEQTSAESSCKTDCDTIEH